MYLEGLIDAKSTEEFDHMTPVLIRKVAKLHVLLHILSKMYGT